MIDAKKPAFGGFTRPLNDIQRAFVQKHLKRSMSERDLMLECATDFGFLIGDAKKKGLPVPVAFEAARNHFRVRKSLRVEAEQALAGTAPQPGKAANEESGPKRSEGDAREAAEKWLRDNDWDYQKYGDRRGDRSAYDTLMNYEISDYLADAFEAGHSAGDAAGFRRGLEEAARYIEKTDALGYPVKPANIRSLSPNGDANSASEQSEETKGGG